MNRWLLLVATAIGLSVLLRTPDCAQSQEKKGIDKLKATDAYGDPLPKGVVARLGSLRWRNPENTLAFSPDGKYLAAAGSAIKLFDASSGQLLRRFEAGSCFLAFSPDSRTLVTTDSTHTPVVRFWDVSTGKERRNFQIQGGTNFLLPCSSADGKRLACYNISYVNPHEKRFVSIWNLETGKEIRKWPDLEAGSIYLSPDGKTFILPYRTHYFLHDADTGKEKARIPFPPREVAGNTSATRFLAFTSDGKMLAGMGKGHVYLWDTGTGKVVHQLALPKDEAACVAISANDRTLAAGGRKGTLYLWDLGSRKLLHAIPAPVGRDLPIYILALAPDGKKVASQQHLTSWIRVWDVADGRELTDFDETATGVERVTFAQDGRSVISLPAGGPVCHWDLVTGKLQRKIPAKDLQEVAVIFRRSLNNGNLLDAPVCSLDGKTFVKTFYSGDELKIGLWRDGKQEPASSFKVGTQKLRLRELVLSPDGKRVAGLGSDDRDIFLIAWDLARGQELRRFRLPAYTSSGVAFSADGRTLITNHTSVGGQSKTTFSFWELTTGKQRRNLDYELGAIPTLPAVLFHDRLAAMIDRETVTLIDLSTGKKLGRLQGHDDDVSCLAFSKGGRHLASGSRDSTVLIWNLAPLKPEVANAKLSEKELADCWDELAGANSAKAYQAIRHLSAARDQAVTYLSQRLSSAPHVPTERIQALIADLDSKTFANRDKATKELVSLQEAAEALLQKVLKGNSSLELRRRVESILLKQSEARTKLPPLGPGEELQAVRAVEVLEMIGTPEAQAVLGRLEKGAPQALRTREAQGSLGRVGSRD
jgi:WD40 repeat protein